MDEPSKDFRRGVVASLEACLGKSTAIECRDAIIDLLSGPESLTALEIFSIEEQGVRKWFGDLLRHWEKLGITELPSLDPRPEPRRPPSARMLHSEYPGYSLEIPPRG